MDTNYGYRYQLITGISLFKNEGDRKKVDKNDYVKRSIYHFMKKMNQEEKKEKEEEKEFKI